MSDHELFFLVCPRCLGTGTAHAGLGVCTFCHGARVMRSLRTSRAVALEFLRVAQATLALLDKTSADALRQAVSGTSRWMETHASDSLDLRPVELLEGTRKP